MKKKKTSNPFNYGNTDSFSGIFKEVYGDTLSDIIPDFNLLEVVKEIQRKQKFKKEIDKKIEDLLK